MLGVAPGGWGYVDPHVSADRPRAKASSSGCDTNLKGGSFEFSEN